MDRYDYRKDTDETDAYFYGTHSARKPLTGQERTRRNKKNKQARKQRKR